MDKEKIEQICEGIARAMFARGEANLKGDIQKFNKMDWEIDKGIVRLMGIFNGPTTQQKL